MWRGVDSCTGTEVGVVNSSTWTDIIPESVVLDSPPCNRFLLTKFVPRRKIGFKISDNVLSKLVTGYLVEQKNKLNYDNIKLKTKLTSYPNHILHPKTILLIIFDMLSMGHFFFFCFCFFLNRLRFGFGREREREREREVERFVYILIYLCS